LLLSATLLTGATGGAQAACNLQSAGGKIKHVIHITFDNVHLRRDNPNVPSDLEQIPNLLNFIRDNGIITGNHHTPLISHTATDILTTLTGVYGERMGVPVANSYGVFHPSGSVTFSSSFLYWTALSGGANPANGDGKPEMVNEFGVTSPAPWVPFTRAGCDVGAFSTANIEFETVPGDVRTVFGVGSPQDIEVTAELASSSAATRSKASTDYLGIAVHCAQSSPLCSGSHGRTDALPDEPGGYVGFNALFGSVNVAPVVCAAAPGGCNASGNVLDLNNNIIADAFGNPGFPGFSPAASQSLGYVATMLEGGIPIIYLYIADAHDRNPLAVGAPSHAFGPGEAEYVAQLKAYDVAFGKFFARLAADGITKDNTLFVVVPDENDHFVGSQPTPANCDGVNVPCTYSVVSEISASLNRLLLTQRGNATTFSVHSDDAPTVYIIGNPAPSDAVTRTMEHDLDALTGVNPITGNTDKLSAFLADQAEMKLLHMVTSSPARTPTMTMFGNDNYFFSNVTPNTNCSLPPACISVAAPTSSTFAWNHGDVQKDITRTWMGMVGPGVRRLGRDDAVFSDHTDVRPTLLALIGLRDDYVHDGRVVAEWVADHALPSGIGRQRENFIEVARAFKQLNAPLGSVGRHSLVFANRSITSDDATYAGYLAKIGAVTTDRDALAGEIKSILDGAAFANQPIDERHEDDLVRRARKIIERVEDLAQPRHHDSDDHRDSDEHRDFND
jgi:hypothetical protein